MNQHSVIIFQVSSESRKINGTISVLKVMYIILLLFLLMFNLEKCIVASFQGIVAGYRDIIYNVYLE